MGGVKGLSELSRAGWRARAGSREGGELASEGFMLALAGHAHVVAAAQAGPGTLRVWCGCRAGCG